MLIMILLPESERTGVKCFYPSLLTCSILFFDELGESEGGWKRANNSFSLFLTYPIFNEAKTQNFFYGLVYKISF